MAEAPSGERKQINILVDTGAEVNLIKPGLFDDINFESAEKPLKLVTVSGSNLGGGQRTIELILHLHGTTSSNGDRSHHLMGGIFYEADIGWDAIMSYPQLHEQLVSVLPHRNCLILDRGDHFIMLKGGKPCSQECGQHYPHSHFTDHYWLQHCSDGSAPAAGTPATEAKPLG
jgi:hypothetical protein